MSLQKYRADRAGEAGENGSTPFYAHWMGGATLALVRNCPTDCPGLSPRTVYVQGEPDTWFSIPAACVYRGKRITGYLTSNEQGYEFRIHTDQLSKVQS